MNVKKFTAATSREALRKVRDALGPDAVILSNRPVDGVVEILALDNDDVASLASPAAESEMAAPQPRLDHLHAFEPEAPAFVNRRAAAPAPAPAPEHVFAPRRAAQMEPEFEAAFSARRPAAAPAEPAFDMAAMTQMMQAAIA